MKKKNWILLFVLNLIVLLLGILPFLPGPKFLEFANSIYSLLQIGAIFGLILIPLAVISIGIGIFKKSFNNSTKYYALLCLTLPLTLLTSVYWISNHARDFSRNYAIEQSENLISAIENYKMENQNYPDSIEQLTPRYIKKIPSDRIIGISGFHYSKDSTEYKIEFSQNVILGFNFEIVQYSPNGKHKSEGELTKLYDTKHPKWKYYIYD